MPSLGGCFLFGNPSKANIELRKQVQKLDGEVAQLKQQHETDEATIKGLTQRTGTVPTLEPARLEKLFTASSIGLGKMTGGVDLDPSKPGDEGFKVYVKPYDQYSDHLKAAGSFVVEAFDLADQKNPSLGRWEFPVEKAQDNWHSFLTRYEYVLTCPWQNGRVPHHGDVTVKVTFTDELTGRVFTRQTVAKVNPPPAGPSTQSADEATAKR